MISDPPTPPTARPRPAPEASPSAARRPLRKDAERNRDLLLRAADEMVAETGLAISLNELARRAGVGVGTVYRHFPDTEAVIDALFEQRVHTIVTLFQAALEVEDPVEGLRQALFSVSEVQADDLAAVEVLAFAENSDQRQRMRSRIQPLAATLVERAKATGRIRPELEPTDLPMIMLMVRGISDYARPIRPELWRRYVHVLLDGFLAGPEPREPIGVPGLSPTEIDQVLSGSLTRRR